MPCPEDAVLLAFADGELGAEDAAPLALHLDECDECRAVLAEAGRRSSSGDAASTRRGRLSPSGAGPLERGQSVGRYLILHPLGEGGMGVVYAAHDPDIDRTVALKLLRPHVTESGATRLLREAQALARVKHPNVIAVYDVGTFGDQVFMAMEFVEGTTLSAWMRERPRGRRELLEAFLQAGRGLAAAHAAGIVHRDFKPSNVLVDPDGVVKVVDFGLALAEITDREETWGPSPDGGSSPATDRLTATGLLLGTPAYMAPEQRTGALVDSRADQYSFCLALYEALCGERGKLPTGTAETEESSEPGENRPWIRRPPVRIPRRLLRALRRGLAARPEDRFPSTSTLLTALERRWWPRRHPAAAASLLLTVGAATAAILAATTHPGELCQGAERELAGIWDPGVQATVRKAFLATGGALAPSAATKASALLDRYARAWVAEHRDACEATRLRGDQSETRMDQRMTCLARRLQELRATTALLARADAPMVERAVRMVSDLRPAAVCRTPAMLRANVQPPTDPRRRARVEALQQRLAELDAARRAGRYAQSIPAAREALREAVALEHRSLEAEALALLGTLQESGGDIREAEQTLIAATRAAQASRHDHLYVEVAIRLIRLYGYRKRDYPAAQSWAADAASMLERMGGDLALGGMLNVRLGRVFHELGRYPEALRRFERGTAMLLAALGRNHLSVAEAFRDHSLTLWRMGRYAEAERLLRRSLAIQEEIHGPNHPEVAHALNGLGLVRWNQGKLEEALRLHQRALAIRQRALAPDHPDIATSLNNLALVLRHLGRYREAAARYRSALALREKIYGPIHKDVAMVLANLAVVLTEQGRYEEALRLAERSYRTRVKVSGEKHPVVAYVLANRGKLLLLLGRAREAIPVFEQALERFKNIRKGHPDATYPLLMLGEAHLVLGERHAAWRLFRRALEHAERSGRRPVYLARALSGLGRTALARGRPREALRYLERALALPKRSRRDKLQRAVVRFAMARALWSRRVDRRRALGLARRARTVLATERGGRNHDLPLVERWLKRHHL